MLLFGLLGVARVGRLDEGLSAGEEMAGDTLSKALLPWSEATFLSNLLRLPSMAMPTCLIIITLI